MPINNPNPLTAPTLRDDLPRYPGTLQLLRVTAATVPGPTGGVSAGVGTGNIAPAILYVASTQQLRTDTLAPRDREPCLVTDTNGLGLTAGYYLGRLAGTYQSLPVYEVATVASSGGGSSVPGPPGPPGPQGPAGSSGLLPGLTPTQLATINASLTPLQISDLNNLNACQLQVLLQLPVVNIQLLADLSPTQLGNVVDGLTYTQLSQVATQVSVPQTLVLTSAYPQLYQAVNQLLTPSQALALLTKLTSQQFSTLVGLTPTQLQVVAQLTVVQVQTLTDLTQAQVTALVGQLTATKLGAVLTALTPSQLQQLANNFTAVQIQRLLYFLTASQVAALTTPQLTTLLTITSAQLRVASQLTNVQLQALTSFTSEQVSTLVGQLTVTQVASLLTVLSTVQLQTLADTFTSVQIQVVLQAITVLQLSTILSSLTTSQLLKLSEYSPATIGVLVTGLSTIDLGVFLTIGTPPPSPILGSQAYFPNVPSIAGQPSSVPFSTLGGFAPVAVDTNTGRLWAYVNGAWAAVNNLSQMSGSVGTAQLDPSGVAADTYGDATHVGQFIVNAAGQIEAATNVAITGSGGGITGSGTGGKLVIWTGSGASTDIGDSVISYTALLFSVAANMTWSSGFGSVTVDAQNNPQSISSSGGFQVSAGSGYLTLSGTSGILIGTGASMPIGLYGTAGVVRAGAITAPTGGIVTDTEARTAINAILAAINSSTGIGITA